MKAYLNVLIILFFFSIVVCSCSSDDENIEDVILEERCLFVSENLTVLPVCSFNPKTNTTVNFPVLVQYEGETIGDHALYDFSWSSNADFKGSAISISYDNLPLTVTVTELATDCVSETTIAQAYWD